MANSNDNTNGGMTPNRAKAFEMARSVLHLFNESGKIRAALFDPRGVPMREGWGKGAYAPSENPLDWEGWEAARHAAHASATVESRSESRRAGSARHVAWLALTQDDEADYFFEQIQAALDAALKG